MFWKREKENQTLKGVAVGSETYDLENVRDLLVGGLGEGNGHVVRDTSVVDCKPEEPVRFSQDSSGGQMGDMLTENTNIDSLNDRFQFRKRSVLVGEINGNELGLDLVLRSYRPPS